MFMSCYTLHVETPTDFLKVNGRTADIAITTHGSDFYFAICAVMARTYFYPIFALHPLTLSPVSGFAFIGLAFRRSRRDRLFHYITASVVFVAAIAYFTMGSNLGFTPIPVEYHRSNPRVAGNNRAIYYVRYIDWFITTPLLLTDLMLTAGMPWPTLLWVIVVDEIMIITGLIGALLETRYKWAYFVFGTFSPCSNRNPPHGTHPNVPQAALLFATSSTSSSGKHASTHAPTAATSSAPSPCAAPSLPSCGSCTQSPGASARAAT
jgi:bacteriorhodopsin